MQTTRALRYAGATVLLFAVFEGCSNNDASIAQPNGPPSIAIASISLGHGQTGEGGATSTLVCDHTIGVTLALTNWNLMPPGLCGQTPQCGPVRVSLLDSMTGKQIGSPQFAATLGVDLKLDDLLDLMSLPKQTKYDIQAELVTDSGDLFKLSDGGNNKVQKAFYYAAKEDNCAEPPVGGEGGAAGNPSSEGGAAGFGGMPDFGQAGAEDSAGEGGTGGASAGAGGARD